MLNRRTLLQLGALATVMPRAGLSAPVGDIAYGGDRLQRLDLYPPEQGQRRPVILYFHGGAWTVGDKSRDAAKGAHFANANFLFAAANYRLSPAVRHPAHIEDAGRALAWLRANAAHYGGDASRIFVMGHSAGAHQAALLATHPHYIRAAGMEPGQLAGAVILDTPSFDLTARIQGPMNRMLSRAFGEDAQTLRDASPLHQVQIGRAYPPFLLVCAGNRPDAVQEGLAMQSRLRLAGAVADLFEAEGKSHRDVNDDVDEGDDAMGRTVLRFLERYS